METLKIKIDNVLYPHEDEDAKKRECGESRIFYIVAYSTDNGQSGKAKGVLNFRPARNEILKVRGMWTVFNGTRQFKWQDASAVVPENPHAMLHYACELTPGIGPVMEANIWAEYGENWREIQFGKIKGLTQAKVNALHDTIEELARKTEQAEAIAFLLSHNATMAMASSAWEKWGRNTIQTVTGNCYSLCDLTGYGFASVDADVRKSFGIADDDPRRISAALGYCMKNLTERGDTCIPWYLLFNNITQLLQNVGNDNIMAVIRQAVASGRIFFFISSQMVSLRADYDAESAIWQFAGGVA